MSIKSPWTIDIPTLDVCTYIFDNSQPNFEIPLFQDSENPSDSYTKADLKLMVRKLRRGLHLNHSLVEKDVVMVCASNSTLYPMMYLGIVGSSATFCGVNPTYKPGELLRALRIAKPKVMFVEYNSLNLVQETLKAFEGTLPTIYIVEKPEDVGRHLRLKHVEDLMTHGEMDWDKLHSLEAVCRRPALLAFSSGTSGSPKGSIITHRNMVANCEQKYRVDTWGYSEVERLMLPLKRRYCSYLPMYHAAGMILGLHNNAKMGVTTYILGKYTLPKLIQTIHRYKVTDLVVVPTVASSFAKSAFDLKVVLSTLERIFSSSSYMGEDKAREFKRILTSPNVRLQQGWGMTETTGAGTLFPPMEESNGINVGYLCPNMEAKVLDGNGHHVGYGNSGELVLRGPNVFSGYWNDDQATKDSRTADGWHRTGDIVVFEPNGMMSVVGRRKELIKVKGLQVSPSELESVLLGCEHVQDCAVIAVRRNGYDAPQAHIVPSSSMVTASAILKYMDERLSAYKRLTGGIVFTDAIPKSQSGKILHRQLKDSEANGQAEVVQPKL